MKLRVAKRIQRDAVSLGSLRRWKIPTLERAQRRVTRWNTRRLFQQRLANWAAERWPDPCTECGHPATSHDLFDGFWECASGYCFCGTHTGRHF